MKEWREVICKLVGITYPAFALEIYYNKEGFCYVAVPQNQNELTPKIRFEYQDWEHPTHQQDMKGLLLR